MISFWSGAISSGRGRSLAQTSVSGYLAAATDAVGEGVLTITTGTTSVDVTVTAENDNLTGLAKAINDANAGVTATVVTDSNGARLMVKGKTGAANAFTLSVPGGTTSGLERFASDVMSRISSSPITS